jgi:hypothetical protein
MRTFCAFAACGTGNTEQPFCDSLKKVLGRSPLSGGEQCQVKGRFVVRIEGQPFCSPTDVSPWSFVLSLLAEQAPGWLDRKSIVRCTNRLVALAVPEIGVHIARRHSFACACAVDEGLDA